MPDADYRAILRSPADFGLASQPIDRVCLAGKLARSS